MAKAYQCDRCFRYYTENKDVIPRGFPTNCIATGLEILTRSAQKTKNYELCDDCLRKIVDFIDNKSNTI